MAVSSSDKLSFNLFFSASKRKVYRGRTLFMTNLKMNKEQLKCDNKNSQKMIVK